MLSEHTNKKPICKWLTLGITALLVSLFNSRKELLGEKLLLTDQMVVMLSIMTRSESRTSVVLLGVSDASKQLPGCFEFGGACVNRLVGRKKCF